MEKAVHIQMMGAFTITCGEETLENLASKSHKGVSLVEYLVLHEGKMVSSQRLIREFWPVRMAGTPESALKTLVSRTRALLNDAAPGLGSCIVSEMGGYRWQTLPGMSIDASEIITLLQTLRACEGEERRLPMARLLKLYAGDLYLTGDMNNGIALAGRLHREYLDCVYAHLDYLREREEYNEICRVCRKAMQIDSLDDNLHIELMRAMVNLNRAADAMQEYQRLARDSQRYLDAPPSEDMQTLYRQLTDAGDQLRFNLDVIRNELEAQDREQQTAFFCDYRTFKEFYNIQMRNLERLGTTMSLGMIMIGETESSVDSIHRESAMAGLMEILRKSLRKGDIVTRYAPHIVAMLLPTVNYSSGTVVMERIAQVFREQYPGNTIPLLCRVSLLGGSIV